MSSGFWPWPWSSLVSGTGPCSLMSQELCGLTHIFSSVPWWSQRADIRRALSAGIESSEFSLCACNSLTSGHPSQLLKLLNLCLFIHRMKLTSRWLTTYWACTVPLARPWARQWESRNALHLAPYWKVYTTRLSWKHTGTSEHTLSEFWWNIMMCM